ncbi:MAG: hypothetical protein M1825_005468 [Sarcosagium campestre]|nr:MAG: hypothetical protein M1825_005468 [Sarcosagium campestre]
MSQSWDFVAKVVALGDSGSGKSSLTIRLCEGRFSAYPDTTIGVEFSSRIVPVGPPFSDSTTTTVAANPSSSSSSSPSQKHMKLSIWDTAGQETYKSVTRSYFRGASAALLVYDISRRPTFTHVTDWLADLRAIAEPDIVVILVGNKCDLADPQEDHGHTGDATGDGPANKRQVTREEAEQWCADNGVLKYVETSAKSGKGVETAFLEVAARIWQNIEAGRYDLADRRSGVKAAGKGTDQARKIRLGMNDTTAAKASGGGGCC